MTITMQNLERLSLAEMTAHCQTRQEAKFEAVGHRGKDGAAGPMIRCSAFWSVLRRPDYAACGIRRHCFATHILEDGYDIPDR